MISQITTTFSQKKIVLAIALGFLLLTGFFYRNQALAFHFVDEEYNFAIGKYLLKGEVLYDDIITNHQPLTHIFSTLVQSLTHPNSTFSLISKHREGLIVWSIIWSLIIVYYFRLAGLVAVAIYELTKIYLLGHLFLAEALVVYPLMFLTGVVLTNKVTFKRLELIFIGFCGGLVTFLLGPIWPALGFLILIILFRQRTKLIPTMGWITLGALIPILMILKYTSIPGYFYVYLYSNLAYTVPAYSPQPWLVTLTQAMFTPVIAWLSNGSTATLRIIQLTSVLLLINLIVLGAKKDLRVLIAVIFLGLANIRFIYPGSQQYQGFHLLPWYASLILITCLLTMENLKKSQYFKVLSLVILIGVILMSLNYAREELFKRRDQQKNFEINYSTEVAIGEAVKIMKSSPDTVFTTPDNWLVYWQSETNHLPKLMGYYSWMAGQPQLHAKVLDTFEKSPPTFFYCNNCPAVDLKQFTKNYQQIKKNGGESRLYVLPSRVKTLTKAQFEQLKFYNFSFD